MTPDNPQAFPSVKNWVTDTGPRGTRDYSGVTGANEGMSLRDWFAGMVLDYATGMSDGPLEAAKLAYGYADAMLKQREKGRA